MSKKVVVVGSGSGGLTAAIGLSKVGYQVTLIEKDHIGGDCTNYGCIPSKALLYRAHRLHNSYETFDYIKDLEKHFKKSQRSTSTSKRCCQKFPKAGITSVGSILWHQISYRRSKVFVSKFSNCWSANFQIG
ncbi:FAD-dependent oxidoreductase [Candidatus Gracilibacteria bacterium]|nr:FAD-dependent oxidoreductase [Candidatus Gracilibacteria bacterium]